MPRKFHASQVRLLHFLTFSSNLRTIPMLCPVRTVRCDYVAGDEHQIISGVSPTIRVWTHSYLWLFLYIFMKSSERRAGMCLISCGRPAAPSLQDPSEVSASLRLPRLPRQATAALPGWWMSTGVGGGRNMCYIRGRCLQNGRICQAKDSFNGDEPRLPRFLLQIHHHS